MSVLSTERSSPAPEPGRGGVSPLIDPRGEAPIRAELYGIEHLEEHARGLASACRLAPASKAPSPLLKRFAESGAALAKAHREILVGFDRREGRGLDAEWLVDNYHIVDEVLREIEKDLPSGYDAELPKLAVEPLAGYPRVYALALALVAHTDGGLDEPRLTRFVDAFQSVAPLTIGELWAVPTMLRLVLLENLRRLADEMLRGRAGRRRADEWGAAHLEPGRDGAVARSLPVIDESPAGEPASAYVVRLMELLRDQGPGAAPALERVAADLERHGVDSDALLRDEHRRQAASQLSIGNAVTSLRLLSALDWNAFFERSSRVEATLRDDPSGVYTRQDFLTRDRTRQAVERIAKGSGVEEVEVARRAVERARAGLARGAARGTVACCLLDNDARAFEAELGYRPEGRERLLRFVLDHPRLVYFGLIAVLTAALVAPFAAMGTAAGPWMVALAVLVLLVPASEIAIGVVHHVLTLTLPPRVLPKLDFRDGIAADCPTFVVMPSMLVRPESAAVLIERLEIHYLTNPDAMLRFALLTDFADAPEENRPEDEGYVREALEGIRSLNERYAAGGPDKFFLFHRKRLWNPKQGVWMGWERKRGKLSEFNRLLRGATDTSYAVASGDISRLPETRFVITLDADTMLLRDTARRLVGTMAHPLNLPVFDPEKGRVVEGFGVLQPRVSIHLTGASRTRFTRILAGSAGIDPYSTAVSDVYMDLFDSGSFTGKGIYDVDAFESATGRTFPENQILSHDLIEGNYARCGLVTDIELFDDFPSRYHAYARREHRWVRGDWQLLPWLGPTVPTADGARPNPLPAPERWKVLDNLRRSLVPPSVVLLLVLGWTVLPGPAWLWTLLALAVPALPLVQQVSGALIGAVRKGSLAPLGGLRDVPATAMSSGLTIAFLADQARLLVEATGRTLYRLFVSRKQMLEWETAAATERRLGTGVGQFFETMWPAPTLAVALGGLVAATNPVALPAAAPVLVAWLASPGVAYWVSRPGKKAEEPLTEDERDALRRIARRTWRFFETFVGAEDQWLPPDNFQEEGGDRVAHRTSPTNQGLLLISTLSAHDLGYIGLRALVDRLDRTMATLESLERHKGHFYNWYRTDTLADLPPAYISTVDSGNMLGCLVALRGALREKAAEPIIGPSSAHGLADALGLALESLRAAKGKVAPKGFAAMEADLLAIGRKLAEPPGELAGWDAWLGSLEWDATRALGRAKAMPDGDAERAEDLVPWLKAFEATIREHRADLAALGGEAGSPASLADLASHVPAAAELLARIRRISDRAAAFIKEMDFTFLYKDDRHLFSIGANLAQDRLDASCYDLLASESCLTSYLAVARGEVPRRHWFQLGRPYIKVAGRIGLLSWGGTMFEYLMPRLLMKTLPGTLIDLMIRATIARQIEYGRQSGVPWGISESGFAAQYPDGDYQYQSFGVPGLGLKRGLARDLVVAPYATALAAMIAPREALANFRRLEAEGGLGHYGYYEAIDYTPERLPRGAKSVVVKSYMAHHQGMSLIALANATLGDPMPRRFHLSSVVRSSELLLQERLPREVPLIETPDAEDTPDLGPAGGEHAASATPMIRRIGSAATPAPRTHLLSNGRYSVMVTNAGSGYSTCHGLDVTRWREDITRDPWGQFLYIRDLASGVVWSAGHQPTRRAADDYEVVFSADKASFRRRDEGIVTKMEVAVSPEGAAEFRRVTLTNFGNTPRELDVTSYAEVVLGPRGADLAHPAFNKLFLETEWLDPSGALLCRRRPRSDDQEPTWALHISAADAGAGPPEYETDRARFLGRGRTPASPSALDPGAVLSGTVGAVLDPIFSIRRRVHLEPGGSATIAFTTALARDRDEALVLAGQYREPGAIARAFDMAWANSQIEHRHRRWSPEEAVLYQRFAAHLIYAGPGQRSAPEVLAANTLGQPGLWRAGVSGDRPIALVRLVEPEGLTLAAQVLDAHAYLRHKGLEFDLVLLDARPSSYNDELHEEMMELVRSSYSADLVDQPGGVFVRDADALGPEATTLLQASARVVIVGGLGTLGEQLDRAERPHPLPPPLATTREREPWPPGEPAPAGELAFANGLGGFARDGREYVITVRAAENPAARRNGKPKREPAPRLVLPPAPWINVVANAAGGFIVSETGSGYTWAGNSQANRLTPWSNDPVSDPPGEVVYLRDEETGAVWSPTPLPVADASSVLVRHGQGYTTFERRTHGLDHTLTLCVPPDDPVKVVRLALTNHGERPRRITATYYAEWVLGTTRDAFAPFVVTEVDEESGALLARNPYNADFAGRVAFLDVDRRPRTLTGDRGEFLGRNGSVAMPAALGRSELSGRVGAGLDPCAAVQATLELAPGESAEVVFLIGQGRDVAEARDLIQRHREPDAASKALDDAKARWDAILGAIQVKTPDPALDLMVNRWLMYQALSCRVWGRSAFYQSGGAFGFRDQLQDSMALVYGAPAEARAQLVRSASRQFVEGDVQHWWHPPTGVGVRTRISDDYLWLPYVAAHYVATTGDAGALDEVVPFLDAPVLRPDQEEDYGHPSVSQKTATLYEHCAVALERGCSLIGEHGLPLMGTGDWNDGMNRVGNEGKGESVWVAWFLIAGLSRFATTSEARGDSARAAKYRASIEPPRAAVEASAWDGAWYRRAYFDDGSPLGSSHNDVCRIDSIAESWSVISGAGDPAHAKQAMDAVDAQLVKLDDGLILLFTPPFDHGKLEPGYIKGYLPGIRENGGQYTHASTWVVKAAAMQGRGDHAHELFDILNPVRHAADAEGVERYKVEPYVVVADVYGRPPHVGRGGWTWYTGSASWLWRVAVEDILGFQLRGDGFAIDPCVPRGWPGFELTYRHRSATYRIVVENPQGVERGVASVTLDGHPVDGGRVPLADDGREHEVRVKLGAGL